MELKSFFFLKRQEKKRGRVRWLTSTGKAEVPWLWRRRPSADDGPTTLASVSALRCGRLHPHAKRERERERRSAEGRGPRRRAARLMKAVTSPASQAPPAGMHRLYTRRIWRERDGERDVGSYTKGKHNHPNRSQVNTRLEQIHRHCVAAPPNHRRLESGPTITSSPHQIKVGQ